LPWERRLKVRRSGGGMWAMAHTDCVRAGEEVSRFLKAQLIAWKRRVFSHGTPTVPPRVLLQRFINEAIDVCRVACKPDAALLFDLRGVSEFEHAVLMKALEIPRSEVRPSGWIAREIARPGRVTRSDCLIDEYALVGSGAKRTVLAAEAVGAERLERLAREGIRYSGSDTTHIYCFPTCRHARRVSAAHQMWFASETAARSAGHRPRRVCRPRLSALVPWMKGGSADTSNRVRLIPPESICVWNKKTSSTIAYFWGIS
jgi:hypothetical protein